MSRTRLLALIICSATAGCSSDDDGGETTAMGGDGGATGGTGGDAAGSGGTSTTEDGGSVGGSGGSGGTPEPTRLRVEVRNVSAEDSGAVPVVFAPGVFLVHSGAPPWFEAGTAASAALEQLAEDGAVQEALREAESRDDVLAGFFGADDLGVSYDENPIAPGTMADFVLEAVPGDRLEFGMMWAQSNDVFVATAPGGVALFDGDAPRLVEIQSELSLWDAGTEVNEEPGVGANQAPRQAEPGAGEVENGVITEITDGTDAAGHTYPSLEGTLVVEITLDGVTRDGG